MQLTPRKLFRVVRGSVLDVRNSHPEWKINDAVSNSITKRLAGTLRGLGVGLIQDSNIVKGQKIGKGAASRIPSYQKSAKLGPRRVLHFLGAEAKTARKSGNLEREQTLIDVLRFLAPKKVRSKKGNKNG